MQADTSYTGLDDSWFVGGTSEAPRRALTRAEVFAELEKRRARADARPEPDVDDDFQLDIVDVDPPRHTSAPPELAESWFDRPARNRRL